MKLILSEWGLSVGINITYMVPIIEGDIEKATSTFIVIEGKLYKFEVLVEDSGGNIGKYTHIRAV